jgi:hypothetical protein
MLFVPISLRGHIHFSTFSKVLLVCLFFRFGDRRFPHNVLLPSSHSPVIYISIRFSVFNSTIFLNFLQDVLSTVRNSCSILLHLFPLFESSRFLLPLAKLSLPGPLWTCSLRNAGTVRHIIRLRTPANFFRSPLFPWFCFSGCWLRLTVKRKFQYWSFYNPIVSTIISSLRTSRLLGRPLSRLGRP